MKKVKQFSTSKFQYISCYCLSVLYKRKKLGTTTFQYISCYCLSSCSSNRDINTSNFNTSHVTVYQRVQLRSNPVHEFQYISCYCLSHCQTYNNYTKHISIHLMLLFIISLINRRIIFWYFNTSHVTVYRKQQRSTGRFYLISIHLMLLFICTIWPPPMYIAVISIHLMLLFI